MSPAQILEIKERISIDKNYSKLVNDSLNGGCYDRK